MKYPRRILSICLFIFTAFSVDILSIFNLQFLDGAKYKLLSEKNRTRIKTLYPKRGKIIDRNGIEIAYNVPVYRIGILNTNKREILGTVDDILKLVEKIDISIEELMLRSKRLPHHAYLYVKDNLTWDEYATLSINNFKLKNVILEQGFTRRYNDEAYSHLVGYIGKSNNLSELKDGKTGLEKFYNDSLSGILGNKKIEVNSAGHLVKTLDVVTPINGENLQITIDDKLQKFVFKTLSKHSTASCVVLDIHTGEILACVSVPSYDQYLLSNGMSNDEWKNISDNTLFPLNDRVFKSAYPPGSAFKPFIGYAALSENVITPGEKIYCPGYVKIGNDKFHCWNRYGHGYVNFKTAMACSCDVYFFEISKRLGIENIVKYANMFGFGEKVCDFLVSENHGLIPNRKWKLNRYKTEWKQYDTILTGIGQGSVLATVMQLAVATARLCTSNFDLKAKIFIDELNVSENTNQDKIANIVKDSMFAVCNNFLGTAFSHCYTDYVIAGKTGSAQVRKIRSGEHGINQQNFKREDRDHGLFIGFAPYKKPKYVVAIIVEHGGGGTVAAKIATLIFEELIKNYASK